MTTIETSTPQRLPVWRDWWNRLQQDRGGRAELMRCGTVSEVIFCAQFHLLRRMRGNPSDEIEIMKLALIAAVLSHVVSDVPNGVNLAKQMSSSQGDKAVVSDIRFRQLLRSDANELDERLIALVRVIRQIGGQASVEQLAKDLLYWNDITKRRWALTYYEHAPQPIDTQE